MDQGAIVVLDVGKTLTKLTMWSPARDLIAHRSRSNRPVSADGYRALDISGITGWLRSTLGEFAGLGEIAAIVPVGHGAAACIVDGDELLVAAPDYEMELPADVLARYRAMRDSFALTGSPCLPCGLNLGAQLFWLETIAADRARRGQIVTWPQYWAWVLSGVATTEVTSLGAHTDLWSPPAGHPSPLAIARGWAARLAPLRRAGDVLGPVSERWREECGLPATCAVLCGIHDSNAALLAARLYPEIGDRDSTILSTGTWFIAMRSGAAADTGALAEDRDCLINVDACGRSIPSARFMGGREAEIIEQADGEPIDPAVHADGLLECAAQLIEAGILAVPSFQPGVGPFPNAAGHWLGQRPADQLGRRAAAGLYAAMMADVSLGLVGCTERIVIEGRFAADPVFTRALAALRPREKVYLSGMADNVSVGALSLIDSELPPRAFLTRVPPLVTDMRDYAQAWRDAAAGKSARQSATA